MSELREPEGDRERGSDRHAHDRAGVRVHARRDIDGNRRRRERVDHLDRASRQVFHLRVQPGAENSVDNRARLFAERGLEARLARCLDRLATAFAKVRVCARGVALQVRRAPQQYRSRRKAVLDQPATCDESVAAVVALARDHEHVGDRSGKPLYERVGNSLTRSRHQRVGRNSVLLLADAIEFTALAGVKKNHRDQPWHVRNYSSGARRMRTPRYVTTTTAPASSSSLSRSTAMAASSRYARRLSSGARSRITPA